MIPRIAVVGGLLALTLLTSTGPNAAAQATPEAAPRASSQAGTVVDRRDFGLTYREMVNGIPGIGNDVEITIAIEAIRVK